MGEMPRESELRRANEDLFDEMIDKICGAGSPWSYEEAVHIASDMWDAQGHSGPLPSDYVPKERRRRTISAWSRSTRPRPRGSRSTGTRWT